MNIAIDGPAGAGKSTVAKAVAKEWGFVYVDTGAMYRTIGYYFLRNGISPDDPEECGKALPGISVTIRYEDGIQKLILNGEDVTGEIRTQEVGEAASKASAQPAVREKLLELQRQLARENDVVMDGRDIGTVILPDAELKIYLTASTEVRAKRRYLELLGKGQEADLSEIEKEIRERDERDMNRSVAPLRQADDAVLVDSSDLTAEEVVSVIGDLIRKKKESLR